MQCLEIIKFTKRKIDCLDCCQHQYGISITHVHANSFTSYRFKYLKWLLHSAASKERIIIKWNIFLRVRKSEQSGSIYTLFKLLENRLNAYWK